MSKVFIETSTLSSIGDAIRTKGGTTELIPPQDMATAITNLPSGGAELPEEAFTQSGSFNYKYSGGGWDWFIKGYGNRVTTKDISNLSYAFDNTTVSKIPFDLNITANCNTFSNIFYFAKYLTEVPLIKGPVKAAPTSNYSGTCNFASFFTGCNQVREIPHDYFLNFFGEDYWKAHKDYQGDLSSIFWFCYSLRELPNLIAFQRKPSGTYNTIYNHFVCACYSLNKALDIPVIDNYAMSSNAFTNTFDDCWIINDITFEMNEDNTPKVASWKNQIIDLTVKVGYTNQPYVFRDTTYNNGITAADEVTDGATYQALKDTANWFSGDINYSHYNKASAIRTINSLPNCSAYGTNTIKFQGASGALTDGGAINTMTDAEIAVATAKGWTVTFV